MITQWRLMSYIVTWYYAIGPRKSNMKTLKIPTLHVINCKYLQCFVFCTVFIMTFCPARKLEKINITIHSRHEMALPRHRSRLAVLLILLYYVSTTRRINIYWPWRERDETRARRTPNGHVCFSYARNKIAVTPRYISSVCIYLFFSFAPKSV